MPWPRFSPRCEQHCAGTTSKDAATCSSCFRPGRASTSSVRWRPPTRPSRRARSRLGPRLGASLSAQFVARRTLLGEYEAPWIDDWRATLEDVLQRARECYATACLGLGGTELASAERAARQLVRSAPLRESATALLMQALERQGNAAEALLVYESLRERLRDELGVAPAEPLQVAYRRLLGAPASD
jgi:DNA-binding SARP family transcriptional activator